MLNNSEHHPETDEQRDNAYRVGMQISFHLTEIAKLIQPDLKITLLMRKPGYPAENAVITAERVEDTDEVCADLRSILVKPYRSLDMI